MAGRPKSKSRLVYSSDQGFVANKASGKAADKTANNPGDGTVRVSRSTKGRKGKGVTVVTGVPLQGAELKKLARALKQRCGSGGTVKGDVIEIQGDHRAVLVEQLSERGYTVKLAGG